MPKPNLLNSTPSAEGVSLAPATAAERDNPDPRALIVAVVGLSHTCNSPSAEFAGGLQAWAAEVASPEGGAISDFGTSPGGIVDRNDLAEILTMVIWTAGHSS